MTGMERAALRELITRHESYRRHPYRCSAGKLTIGIGRNLEDVGIDLEEARYLLDRDIRAAELDLCTFPWFESLSRVRRDALIDMRFQLGPVRFRGFKKMIAALAAGDYDRAEAEALDSKYATLDTPARAATVGRMLRTGQES